MGEYLERLAAILNGEQPDLVLPGRDDDVLALAQLKERLTALRPALPVGPYGRVRGLICTFVHLVMGRPERIVSLDDAEACEVARRYVDTFAAAGWIGVLNMQRRRDSNGKFRVYELNGRFTGSTAARLHLGFDEVGLVVEAFSGHTLPPRPSIGRRGIVTKSLVEFATSPADIEPLRATGRWQRDAARRNALTHHCRLTPNSVDACQHRPPSRGRMCLV